MRLRIDRPNLSIRTPFRFVTASATIDVIRESQDELRWTWHDGREFQWQLQRRSFKNPPSWRVVSQEGTYSGQLVNRPSRYSRINTREWCGDGHIFHQDSGFCSGAVRSAKKRRILFWKTNCSARALWGEVVCSDRIPESQVPILLGFVLSEFWNQGSSE